MDPFCPLTGPPAAPTFRALPGPSPGMGVFMKVLHSLKSAKKRDRDCRVVRRKGRVYVINKRKPRFKARQG